MKTKADISIIFSDLDGTLLDDHKQISRQTLLALNEARRRNIKLIIATSRILRTSLPYAEKIESDGIIFCGGAGTLCDGKLINVQTIPENLCCSILEAVSSTFPDIRFSVVTIDKMYTNFDGDHTIHITENYWDKIVEPLRIVFYNPPIALEAFLRRHWETSCHILLLEGKNLLVTAKEASKEKAMSMVLGYYGIDIQHAAYFGDDFSDYECIRRSRYGITMQNASEKMKNTAQIVCKSNNENGVAQWLTEHLRKRDLE